MKNFLKYFTILFFVVALLSGCADKSQVLRGVNSGMEASQNDSSEVQLSNVTIDLLIEPPDAVGLLLTPAIRERKAKFYEVVFPEILFLGEIFPGRIKWFGWASDGQQECLAQLLWIEKVRLDGKVVGVIAVDNPLPGMRVVGFSTRLNYVYSLDYDETEISSERGKIVAVSEYRKEMTEKYGVEISTLKNADYMYSIIEHWNRVEGPRGEILTPLKKEDFDKISQKNPAYSWSQKWVENFSGTISIDPIQMGVVAFMETVTAAGVNSQGWDFAYRGDSRAMAVKSKHLIDVKFAGIRALVKKISENGGTP